MRRQSRPDAGQELCRLCQGRACPHTLTLLCTSLHSNHSPFRELLFEEYVAWGDTSPKTQRWPVVRLEFEPQSV